MAGCDQGGLVADIGDIGTGESGSLTCQQVNIHRVVGLDTFEMHLENLHTVVEFGQFHIDLTVETACAEERLVEDVGAVGGCEDYHARVGGKTVHLGKQLVKRVFTLVIGAHIRILAAGTAHGVDFVDEDNAGGFLLGFLEEVAYTRSAHTHKHFHEVGTRHREERHVGFSGYGFGQQGLAGSRRAYQKCTFGYLAAEIGVALRIF